MVKGTPVKEVLERHMLAEQELLLGSGLHTLQDAMRAIGQLDARMR